MSDQDEQTNILSGQQTTSAPPIPLTPSTTDTCEFAPAYCTISTVLDSLDALVYVTDMETHEILFFNKYGKDIWGDGKGKICWQVLQSGQDGPCEFCTNDKLLDENGQPNDVYVWEFQNTIDGHWYQCRDQAIQWIDGRMVRMEIATDITERKKVEEELQAAKEKAEALARIDELTGLNNRRAFFHDGEQLLKQSRRFAHPLCLIMLDVDLFKQINDSYGHTAGDAVLESIADILKQNVREVDVLGRLGGEEFAVILPEIALSDAMTLAERLRAEIEKTRINSTKGEIRSTASLGLAALTQETTSLESLISQADDALYQAKNNGRNRIENNH